jgi:hypothetical protein
MEGEMIFKINHLNLSSDEDYITIEGDEVEDCREKAQAELKRRGWHSEDCWSEKIS